jgi:hypothetical protein
VPSAAFQAADGPLRWAYRDTSLRSYYLTHFRLEDAQRGPVFFFLASGGTLHEVQGADSLQRIAVGLLLSDAPAAARDVWRLEYARDPAAGTAYRLAWMELSLGRPDSARVWLERGGATPDAGPAPEVRAAYERVTAGDTARAIAIASEGVLRHALDPGVHALLADLLLVHQGVGDAAVIESHAARVLAPEGPRPGAAGDGVLSARPISAGAHRAGALLRARGTGGASRSGGAARAGRGAPAHARGRAGARGSAGENESALKRARPLRRRTQAAPGIMRINDADQTLRGSSCK